MRSRALKYCSDASRILTNDCYATSEVAPQCRRLLLSRRVRPRGNRSAKIDIDFGYLEDLKFRSSVFRKRVPVKFSSLIGHEDPFIDRCEVN